MAQQRGGRQPPWTGTQIHNSKSDLGEAGLSAELCLSVLSTEGSSRSSASPCGLRQDAGCRHMGVGGEQPDSSTSPHKCGLQKCMSKTQGGSHPRREGPRVFPHHSSSHYCSTSG